MNNLQDELDAVLALAYEQAMYIEKLELLIVELHTALDETKPWPMPGL